MKLFVYFAFFCFGFLSCMFLLSYSFSTNFEFPLGSSEESLLNAPGDFIGEKDIVVESDRIILNVANVSISRYSTSGSMIPVLDYGSNGIRVVVNDEDDVGVGDIISYKRAGRLIVHRVVLKGKDIYGVYFVTAGDNNNFLDGKVRIDDIEYKTIGILY